MHRFPIRSLFVFSTFILCVGAFAQDKQIVVGTKVAAPFVIEDAQGNYTGLSIDLWKKIADRLGLVYRYQKSDLSGLISGLEEGKLDISVAALSATPGREAVIDFSHPFYITGYAIAVPDRGNMLWLAVKRFFSWEFFTALVALTGVLFVAGFLLWLAERHRNPAMFGGKRREGIGASFWWAAVTMTTVGYGDKAPVTLVGRVIAIVWMFASVIIISSFTAAIATSLTVSQLETSIKSLDDLRDARVSTVKGSASAAFLDHLSIHYASSESLNDSLQALANGKVNAVVYDAPIMRYEVKQNYRDSISVLQKTFVRQDYAFALPINSPLRKKINQAILDIVSSDDWQTLVNRYLDK